MLRKKVLAAAVASLGLATPLVHAEEAASPHSLTGNLTFASNYHTRGVSQTYFQPAVQGTIEYGHASGFYAGLFGSNVSWFGDGWGPAAAGQDPNIYGGCHPSLASVGCTNPSGDSISNSFEVDLYAGLRNKFMGDFTYDVGAIYYYYPGKYQIDQTTSVFGVKEPHTGEIYGGLGWKWISGKVYYALTDVFGVADARGTMYYDLTATVPIGESGFNIIGHIGFWNWEGAMKLWKDGGTDNSVYNATDYKLGVTKDFAGFSWGLFYWGSDGKKTTILPVGNAEVAVWGNRFGKNVTDDTVFLTVTKAF